MYILPDQLWSMDNSIYNGSADHGAILLVNWEGYGFTRLGFMIRPAAVDQILQIDSARLSNWLLERRLHYNLQYGRHKTNDFVYLIRESE